MDIIRFVIDNPVKVAVGVILVMLFGSISIFDIPKQLIPDVDRPVITVTTNWTGASPQEIESEIVDRQEDKLKSVDNLRKMTSVSTEGQGVVKLEFPVGTDKNVAMRDVSDKLRQVEDYPEEVDEPTVMATDDDMANIIAWMILRDESGKDIAYLKTFVEDKVKPILERAEGVSEVNVYGGLDREVQVMVDAHRLAARGLTMRDLEAALRQQNENISAGTIPQGKRDLTYRTVGEFTSIHEIEDTVVAFAEGGPIQVRDVAQVVDGFKRQRAFVRSEGDFVIAMPARRETGANVLAAMESLKAQIAKVNREILEPKGLNLALTQVYDETNYITSAIDLVINNIFIGGLLTILSLILFLRSWAATGVIALSIPISTIGTFLVIYVLDRSLNVIMLAGLAFAVGMVVDNAIVVLENIYRHRSMGKSAYEATLDGSREVWAAVVASTMTTMVVFLPVVTIKEEAGQLFKDIAIAISGAVLLSLFVAILVVPPLSVWLLRKARVKVPEDGGEGSWWFGEQVGRLAAWINRTTIRRIATVAGFMAASVLGSWLLAPDLDYLPAGNKNLIFGMLFTPPGYSMDEYRRMGILVEEGDPEDPHDGMRPLWEAKPGSAEAEALPEVTIPVGDKGHQVVMRPPPVKNFFFVAFNGLAFMGCTSTSDTNVKPLATAMSNAGARLPGVFSFFEQASLFSGGGSGNLEIDIRGDNLSEVVRTAATLQGQLMMKDFGFARPDPSNFDLGRPEAQFRPDRDKAADLGLNVADVGFIIRALVDGAFVGEYNDAGDKIDLVIKAEGLEDAPASVVAQTPIYTPTGHVVPLASVVEVLSTSSPQQINHIEEMPSVTLTVAPKVGVPLQTMIRDIEEGIIAPLRAQEVIPRTVFTSLSGTASKLTQTSRALIGDFRGLIHFPAVMGFSAEASFLLAGGGVLAALALTALSGALIGSRKVVRAMGWILGALFLVTLVWQFDLTTMLLQSRGFLSLLVTYLVMAALFESYSYPFIIMFSVPLAAVGGFMALALVHRHSLGDIRVPVQNLDLLAMLGFILLIGIVVNNAILIIHQALNYMRDAGLSPDAAVVRSVQTRTRPIFMTALTTIVGLIPLVVMTGPGSELYRGIGAVVLGGLTVSTLFTLIVVPALFSLFIQVKVWMAEPAAIRTARSGRPVEDHAPARVPVGGGRPSAVPVEHFASHRSSQDRDADSAAGA